MDAQMFMYIMAAALNIILSLVLIMLVRKKTDWTSERRKSLIVFSLIAPLLVLLLYGKDFKTEL